MYSNCCLVPCASMITKSLAAVKRKVAAAAVLIQAYAEKDVLASSSYVKIEFAYQLVISYIESSTKENQHGRELHSRTN